jgi:hypothetical protein
MRYTLSELELRYLEDLLTEIKDEIVETHEDIVTEIEEAQEMLDGVRYRTLKECEAEPEATGSGGIPVFY